MHDPCLHRVARASRQTWQGAGLGSSGGRGEGGWSTGGRPPGALPGEPRWGWCIAGAEPFGGERQSRGPSKPQKAGRRALGRAVVSAGRCGPVNGWVEGSEGLWGAVGEDQLGWSWQGGQLLPRIGQGWTSLHAGPGLIPGGELGALWPWFGGVLLPPLPWLTSACVPAHSGRVWRGSKEIVSLEVLPGVRAPDLGLTSSPGGAEPGPEARALSPA